MDSFSFRFTFQPNLRLSVFKEGRFISSPRFLIGRSLDTILYIPFVKTMIVHTYIEIGRSIVGKKPTTYRRECLRLPFSGHRLFQGRRLEHLQEVQLLRVHATFMILTRHCTHQTKNTTVDITQAHTVIFPRMCNRPSLANASNRRFQGLPSQLAPSPRPGVLHLFCTAESTRAQAGHTIRVVRTNWYSPPHHDQHNRVATVETVTTAGAFWGFRPFRCLDEINPGWHKTDFYNPCH